MKEESVFSKRFKQELKQKEFNNLSENKKLEQRIKVLETIFLELGDKQNRYIFYCPDISVVNNLVKTIYQFAYTVKNLGYNVVILHEIKGFNCKWLLEQYPEYKQLNLEYVIFKRGKKAKKETNLYSFKPTDTLFIPDVFQEILENILEAQTIQKVVLITGYTGIGALPMGYDYKSLGVEHLIYLNPILADDYNFFKNNENNYIVDSLPIDRELFSPVDPLEVMPIICVSKIANDKLAQQVINIFYNKYPHLNFFSFKVLDRTNYVNYIQCLKYSCLFINLDETVGFNQPYYEAINMGVPTATYVRRELKFENKEFTEEIMSFDKDPFEIADFIAQYCNYWLNNPTSIFTENIKELSNIVKIEKYTTVNLEKQLKKVIENLQETRIKFFSAFKNSIMKLNVEKEPIR